MDFLEKILKEKRKAVKRKKKEFSQEKLIKKIKLPLAKSLFRSILSKPGTHLIAEIKRASPSKGDLRPDLDIVNISSIYQRQGVELVSILTEEKFFKGSLDDISKVKQNTSLSILCKDFIIDNYQIQEAKIYGADAILFIASILSLEQLKEFLDISKNLKMDALVEVHDNYDLDKVLKLSPQIEIIGINNRNLGDFTIDLTTTEKLLANIPKDKLVIAESGIESYSQIKKYKELGLKGVLVGEALMREKDIGLKVSEFLGALK